MPVSPDASGRYPSRRAQSTLRIHRSVRNAIRRASTAVDRSALAIVGRAMNRSLPAPSGDLRMRIHQIASVYNRPEVLDDDSTLFPPPPTVPVTATPRPRRCGAAGTTDLRYESSYRPFVSAYAEEYASYHANLTGHARLFHAEIPRPTVICIHGWGGGSYWLEERAFIVDYLYRIGLDVVLFQMPFHGDRTPRQSARSGALFPSAHLIRTNEGFAQAICDLRTVAAYLQSRGVDTIGVMGISLGGYTAALWASLDEYLAFAVSILPAVSISELMWRHGANSPTRRYAEKSGVTQEMLEDACRCHAPTTRPVKLVREKLMIIAGRGDRITPPDQAEALWRHWDEPLLHWMPGGHLAQIGRGQAFRSMRHWLTDSGILPRPFE